MMLHHDFVMIVKIGGTNTRCG